jgi:uncharacterized protein (DUF362 family)/ferredoxin
MLFRVDTINASSIKDIKKGLLSVLENYSNLLPTSKTASILIKPNLNSNMNALTGNTTDLRLIAAVIEFLKENGYRNITIGDGTNSGFYRNRISVIDRLRIGTLADRYGISLKDLNYSEPEDIEFENRVSAGAARECIEADLLINMPKLKTHFETVMSVCLKNLVGCLAGQESKRKAHSSLSANILNINKRIKPHIHIVDAIFSMEGLGPTRGIPVKTGMVIVGTDPYLIDLICAKLSSFNYKKIPVLAKAEERGLITKKHHRFVDDFKFEKTYKFKPPKLSIIASLVHNPRRQKFFLGIRNTSLFNYICSTRLGGKLLFISGVRQDVYIDDEMEIRGLSINKKRCSNCKKCADYCPIGMDLPDDLQNEKCIHCLYCYSVCPENAIEFQGKLGFMEEQIRQYDKIIREIA